MRVELSICPSAWSSEDIAKLTGLEGLVEVSIRLALDIIGGIGLQATTHGVLKVRHGQGLIYRVIYFDMAQGSSCGTTVERTTPSAVISLPHSYGCCVTSNLPQTSADHLLGEVVG